MRDIFIIVFTGIFSVVLLMIAILAFRLYRSARRVTGNVEEISSIVLERVARPLTSLPPLIEMINLALGWVQELRSRGRRSDDDERE